MQTIYKKKNGISARQLGGELMLYDTAQDKVHVLNETGVLVWELLDGNKALAEIEENMRQKFPDAPAETINKDLREIIAKLKQEGLIF